MTRMTPLFLVTALTTGCGTTSGTMTPTQSALAHTLQTQYAAGVDALNAYCAVAGTSPEVMKICAPTMATINLTESAVHAAISALVSVLAKQALEEAVERQKGLECHD